MAIWTFDFNIQVDQPFYPTNRDLAEHLDNMVWNNLSLQVPGTESESPLVRNALLAGGYLTLMFPALERSDDGHIADANVQLGTEIMSQIVKFGILRFAELVESIVEAIRGIASYEADRNSYSWAIAATCVLFCEVDHINQNFHHGKLQLLCVSPTMYDCRYSAIDLTPIVESQSQGSSQNLVGILRQGSFV